MKKRIVLLTGDELRHQFFRKFIANENEINVLATYCESEKGNLNDLISKSNEVTDARVAHLKERELVENFFFKEYCEKVKDLSNPIKISKGQVNDKQCIEEVKELNPDIIIAYGCSIITSSLLKLFKNKFINIHLGLSPYYRGSGTNFWPIVNNEFHCIGTTFMHVDEGIDTGEVIHQIRAVIYPWDNIHQIGNRLIYNSFVECIKLVLKFEDLKKMKPILLNKEKEKYYRNVNFTEKSVDIAKQHMVSNNLIKYLGNTSKLDVKYPIINNTALA